MAPPVATGAAPFGAAAPPTAVPVTLGRRGGTALGGPAATGHAGPLGPAVAPDGERPELLPLDAGEQYRFGFDMGACIGCHSCEVACAEQNGLPAGTVWRRVGEFEGGDHPETRRFHMSMSCNHCLDPACLEGCPTGAYEKLSNGIVAHHADDCVGCGYCTWTCPYSVPAIQPDRRIATKCDMCQPRLGAGHAPACVDACPTHAITIEKVNVAAWREDHASADAPHLPAAGLTLSTTRITLPEGVPEATAAAGDWSLEPEHPHWPLVWLTLLSQAAVGASVVAGASAVDGTASPVSLRMAAAGLAVAGMAGAIGHLGRPIAAWKALRGLRTSWLSREVLLLSLHAALAVLAVLVPAAFAVPAAVAGIAGVYASARLYLLPGRPAWDSQLTIARFAATAVALGGALAGLPAMAAVGGIAGVAAGAANWWRLSRRPPDRAWHGPLRLELGRFRRATAVRLGLTAAGVALAAMGAPAALVLVTLAAGEAVARWLFYVTVVPLDMPGSFWRAVPEGSEVHA